MTPTERSGLLFVLLAAVGYAFLPILAKLIYADAALQPLDVVTWRFLFAVPLVWLALRLLRTPAPAKPVPRLKMVGLGVLFTSAAAFAFFALERIPASLFTVLVYTYPAMVAVLSLLAGERLPLRGWLALTLTLAGVVLTVDLSDTANADPAGILFALANALSYAVYLVLSQRVLRGHSAAGYASAWANTGSLLPLLALMPVAELHAPTLPSAWGGLIALALFSTVMPSFAILAGISRLGASRAAILSTTEPVMTVVLALILLGEAMTGQQLVGGALILASVVLLQLRGAMARTTSP